MPKPRIINVEFDEESGCTFADVQIGLVVWKSYHSWDDDIDQADGYFADLNGERGQCGGYQLPNLDLWSTEAIVKDLRIGAFESHTLEMLQLINRAKHVWEQGEVLYVNDERRFGCPVLIVPGPTIQLLEALDRFQP